MVTIPQLATPTNDSAAIRMCGNDDWRAEQKCVSPMTFVHTDTGIKRIRYINVGDSVMSSNGKFNKVTAVLKSSRDKRDLIDIHPFCCTPYTVTEDHGVLTTNGWKEASKLTTNDWLVLPIPDLGGPKVDTVLLETQTAGYKKEIPVTKDFLWFLGFWLGDGSAYVNSTKTKGRISLAVNRRDQHIVHRLKSFIESIGCEYHNFSSTSSFMDQVYFTDMPLAQWLYDNFRAHKTDGHVEPGSQGKTIPSWIDGLDSSEFSAFLEGYNAADGHVVQTSLQSRLTTTSAHVAGLLYRQLLGRNIPVSLRRVPTSWMHLGELRTGEAWTFDFIRTNKYMKKLDDKWIVKIKSVTASKERCTELFDLTVSDTHDFLTGSIVHNCDGVRLIVEIEGDDLMGVNREGKIIHLDSTIANSFEPFSGTWTFDGELMPDGVYWIFDMPRAGDKIDFSTPYEERRETLNAFYESAFKGSPYIKLLPSYTTSQDKIVLARDVLANNGEGIMLKRRDASYPKGREGKPNRTRNNMKWKFVKTIDTVITQLSIDRKQNVGVSVLDPETSELINIGTVGMTPGNLAKVKIGDVIEVKYLYVENPKSPRLTQPSFVKFRDDKSAATCWIDQITGYTNKSVLTGLSS